jgi:hypothetical protein
MPYQTAMNIASHVRHFLTGLAALGTWFLSWHLIAPDQAAAVNQAGADLITPLTVILSAIGACVARLAMAWAANLFRQGTGEGGGSNPSGGTALLILTCTAAALGGLPSCSPAQLAAARAMPIRIGITTDHGTAAYSSKRGVEVDVDATSAK